MSRSPGDRARVGAPGGYADESEANFVGWLACQHGGASAQYSAALMMIGYVQPPNRPLREALAIGPRTDLVCDPRNVTRTRAVRCSSPRVRAMTHT